MINAAGIELPDYIAETGFYKKNNEACAAR